MTASAVMRPAVSSVRANGLAFDVDVDDGVGRDLGAEALGLLARDVHELRALDAVLEAGKFSTSVVVVSCPPGWMPSRTRGARFARAA